MNIIKTISDSINPLNNIKSKVILFSFPKSGNTWLRFILANYFNLIYNKVDEIDFHIVHEYMPSLEDKKESAFGIKPGFYKTHSSNRPSFGKVVMIARSPYDTLWSFYHYLNKDKQKSIDIESLVYDKGKGINGIINDCNSYLKAKNELYVLSYEQLLENPIPALKGLLIFAGYKVDLKLLENAYQLSAFEQMRKIEDKKGRKYGDTTKFKFTRSGSIGEGLNYFNKNLELKNHIKKELRKSYLLDLLYRNL